MQLRVAHAQPRPLKVQTPTARGHLLFFDYLFRRLLEWGEAKGDVIVIEGTHVNASSLRSLDNRTGRSNPEARFSRGKRAKKSYYLLLTRLEISDFIRYWR